MERERESKRRRMIKDKCYERVARQLSIPILSVLIIVLYTIVVARILAIDPDIAAETLDTVVAAHSAATSPNAEHEEMQGTEAALLAQKHLTDAVPLSNDLQDVMQIACENYACPYPLALAVAEIESHFDINAIGAAGEVGIMQLNPGPGGSYHTALRTVTGADPATPSGNIICGVYLLGKYIDKYGCPTKAIMAYNMGEYGAQKAWAAGVSFTTYTKDVLKAMEGWETAINT